MIQEILEYYFDRKVLELGESLVDKQLFKTSLAKKANRDDLLELKARVADNTTRNEKFHSIENRLLELERNQVISVSVDEFITEMQQRPTLS